MTNNLNPAEILEASPDIIAAITSDGRVDYLNRAATEVLGYDKQVLLDSPWGSIVHPEDRPTLALLWDLILSSEDPSEARWRVRHADGRFVWLDCRMRRVSGIGGGSTPLVVIVAREATSQIELGHALEGAKEAAERADRAKSEFLSRMSHEFRTPLNAILGFTQLLELEELDPEQLQSVREIRSGGAHLLELVNEVLDIGRIEAGKLSLEMEPVHVGTVFTESASMVAPLARERSISFEVEAPADDVFVSADAQRLRQVLLNLLSNAVKYGDEGGSLVLACRIEDPSWVLLDVRDTGPGISPDHVERLFVPFERLGAERSNVPGAGLGLALTKRLVEMMGGHIAVDSVPGRGSTFTVGLLVADDAEADTGRDADVPMGVLYVEDNPANRRLVERLLEKHRPHLQLTTAETGTSGLELARAQRPRAVLLDVNLPDMQGDEVLAALKADPETRDIDVVVVSADASRERMEEMIAAGAAAYVTKPVDVGALLRALDGLTAPRKAGGK